MNMRLLLPVFKSTRHARIHGWCLCICVPETISMFTCVALVQMLLHFRMNESKWRSSLFQVSWRLFEVCICNLRANTSTARVVAVDSCCLGMTPSSMSALIFHGDAGPLLFLAHCCSITMLEQPEPCPRLWV